VDGLGWGVGWEVRDVTSTSVCVTDSVEKFLHSVGGLLQLQAWPGDISYQITLMADTSK